MLQQERASALLKAQGNKKQAPDPQPDLKAAKKLLSALSVLACLLIKQQHGGCKPGSIADLEQTVELRPLKAPSHHLQPIPDGSIHHRPLPQRLD